MNDNLSQFYFKLKGLESEEKSFYEKWINLLGLKHFDKHAGKNNV